MVAVIIVLTLLLLLGCTILFRHFRALRVAKVSIVKQQQKEASLLYQLHEAKERYCRLEEKLRKLQHELQKEKQKEDHR